MLIHKNNFNKIVWAMNPFDRNKKLNQSMIRLLGNLEKMSHASIQPVYVLSPEVANQLAQQETNLSENDLLQQMKKIIRASGLKTVKPPIILKEKINSRRSEVKCLIDYCKEKHISMIAVATHARHGFPRLMLGSFAETLLLLSSLPLVFVNPLETAPRSIKKIFFPTDLGESSKKAITCTVNLADALKAKLQIYSILHIYRRGVLLTQDVGGMSFPMWITIDEAKEKGKSFLNIAKKKRVAAEFKCEEAMGSVVDALLKELVKSKADLISIAAEPLPKLPMMIGSVTRQLVRRASRPIYIYRPVS